MRRFFWFLNRLFMVPAFRLGLGPFMGNPLTGYIMVLRTTGRKTGKERFTPVNYAILDGCIYCLAGFGRGAHWYRNVRANPNVQLILPGGSVAGVAEGVTAPEESLRAARQVLKNGGFAGFFLGFNPFTAPDEVVREKTQGLPLVRIRPTGIGSGASDPGGWLWVLVALAVAWLIVRQSAITRAWSLWAGLRRNRMIPLEAGSPNRRANSPKSLSNVIRMRSSSRARARIRISLLPGASSHAQATSCAFSHRALTASPGTFSLARMRTVTP